MAKNEKRTQIQGSRELQTMGKNILVLDAVRRTWENAFNLFKEKIYCAIKKT